ncbi:hypothetical protein LTR50_005915 [Elasticomyces elasticus]|nr:hypothetical protein LTR50_005915 [Elasticomyces elasticus]
MDYLINEGYPAAAQKFATEANIQPAVDVDVIRQRVDIRNCIHTGDVEGAIERINDLDPNILDYDPPLHFTLLRLQFIELVRPILALDKPDTALFRPALVFARTHLAPRAPTQKSFLDELQSTMSLLVFPSEKLAPQLKALLDPDLRAQVARSVNEAILYSRGDKKQARIRSLVKLRVWAEIQAREQKKNLPAHLGLGLDEMTDPDVMVA